MSSVRLSVTLVDCDHICWKSWKLIARTTGQTPSLFLAQSTSTYSMGTWGNFGETRGLRWGGEKRRARAQNRQYLWNTQRRRKSYHGGPIGNRQCSFKLYHPQPTMAWPPSPRTWLPWPRTWFPRSRSKTGPTRPSMRQEWGMLEYSTTAYPLSAPLYLQSSRRSTNPIIIIILFKPSVHMIPREMKN